MERDALFIELEAVLRREHELAGQLLKATGWQNSALRRNDMEMLNQAVAELSELNGELRRLEDTRETLQNRLENAQSIAPGATLTAIAAGAPGEISARLIDLRRDLRLRLHELRQLTDTNNLLTRNALRMNTTITNIFKQADGGTTYGESGRVQDPTRTLTTLNKSV
ncbi:flagellar export chaperone FlgN [Desulfoscipio sp. XC116]|uniref:flagellar export chaperone FlgN n=1 Tax=Desulfoscipio sp. XC116 TaxID=3144975 RepID=UPI00325B10DF